MKRELEGLLKFGCDHYDEGDAATFYLLNEERAIATEELAEAAERAVKASMGRDKAKARKAGDEYRRAKERVATLNHLLDAGPKPEAMN
jgi:nucleoid-associated protein YgaU